MTRRQLWKPRVLRRFGRLFATAFVLLYTAVVVRAISEEFNARGAVLLALLVYAALSAFVGWLNDRVGGAMLVIASVALACFFGLVAERNQTSLAAFIGGPFLLAGLALLLAAGLYDEWRYQNEETDAER
jgi:MFS family permease